MRFLAAIGLIAGFAWLIAVNSYTHRPKEWRDAPSRRWLKWVMYGPMVALVATGIVGFVLAVLLVPSFRDDAISIALLPLLFGRDLISKGVEPWGQPLSTLTLGDLFAAVAFPVLGVGIWLAYISIAIALIVAVGECGRIVMTTLFKPKPPQVTGRRDSSPPM